MFGRATIRLGTGPHSSFSCITVSVYVAFIFHLTITKFTLYHCWTTRLPNSPRILTAAYKHTSVDAPYTYISCD